jgi:hypothetical protein
VGPAEIRATLSLLPHDAKPNDLLFLFGFRLANTGPDGASEERRGLSGIGGAAKIKIEARASQKRELALVCGKDAVRCASQTPTSIDHAPRVDIERFT